MGKKVTVVGAGFYGSTTALRLAEYNIFDEVVLTDIVEGKPEGLALDINQSRSIEGFETNLFKLPVFWDELLHQFCRKAYASLAVHGFPSIDPNWHSLLVRVLKGYKRFDSIVSHQKLFEPSTMSSAIHMTCYRTGTDGFFEPHNSILQCCKSHI